MSAFVDLILRNLELSPLVLPHTSLQVFMNIKFSTVPRIELAELVISKLGVEDSIILRPAKVLTEDLLAQPSLVLDLDGNSVWSPTNYIRKLIFLH
jgi:hypothetical protein